MKFSFSLFAGLLAFVLAPAVLALDGMPPDFTLSDSLRSAAALSQEDTEGLYQQGEYARALPGLLRDYRTLRREESDPEERPSQEMGVALLFIGNSFAAIGDYLQAETALLWYREMMERRWGRMDRRGGLQPAMWLAEFYHRIGNFDKSRALREAAFGIHYAVDWDAPDASADSVTGPKPFLEAVKLLKEDVVEFAGNDQIRGYELFLEIVGDRILRSPIADADAAANSLEEILNAIPNEEHLQSQRYKGLLVKARYLIRKNDPQAAIKLVEEEAALLNEEDRTAWKGERSLLLAEACLAAGRVADARRYLNESPPSERVRATPLATALLLESGDKAALRAAQQEEERVQAEHSREVLAISSEEQRIRHFQSLKPYSLALALGDAEALARNALRYKGIVLDSILQDARARRRSSDPATRALEEELLRSRQEAHRLLRLVESPEVDASQRAAAARRYREALEQMDGIESRLARQASGYGLVRDALNQIPDNVLRILPANACLLDFVIAHRYAGRNRHEPVCLLLRYWQGRVSLHPCGGLSRILTNVEAIQEAMRRGAPGDAPVRAALAELHADLIGDALNDMPQDARVLISPDGALNFVPFAALVRTDGQMLIQRFDLAYLASARDALNLPAGGRPESALLVGDPDYSLATGPAYAKLDRGSVVARSMGVDRSADSRIVLQRLPGTREEVESLKQLFQGQGVSVQELLGADATESALRRSRDVSLIHIATHGMVLPSGQQDTFSPMTSGIITLAGAQRTLDHWRQGAVGDTTKDGILTADEFSRMNLGRVQTLVLSACETGLGKSEQGEGVMGLRRGLHQAGVGQLLLTLWPIEDAATVEMMRGFYQKLMSANSTASSALTATQREGLARWSKERGLGTAVKLAAPFVLSLGATSGGSGGLLAEAPTAVPAVPPPGAPSVPSPGNDSLLQGERFPATRQRLLNEEDLAAWTESDLRYAINEMFARHGAAFPKNPELQKRFEGMSWYRPREGVAFDDIEADFNEVERRNILTLGAVRDQRKGGVPAANPGFPGERFPETRTRYLTEDELSTWSYADVRYAINEMFARHGATFPKDPEIQKRFKSMSWYQPRPGVDYDTLEQDFNEFEAQNVKTLGAARDQKRP